MYAIHDAKAGQYLRPFFLHNDEMAKRSFMDATINPDSQFYQHPLDYSLFQIGTYDEETSIVKSQCPPEHLITASQCQAQYKHEQKQQNAIDNIHDYQIDKETDNEK